MSKKGKKRVMWMVVPILIVVVFLVLYYVLPYECNYYRVIGIKKYATISETIDCLGEPNQIENVSEKYPSWCWWMVYYDELTLYYRTEGGAGLFRIDIIGDQYKFGWRKVHVGMTRSEIEKIYKNNEQIKDCKKNVLGVIKNDSCWIYFKFDEDDILQMITITDGL
ncbi:MAG: hypothetical protein K2N01_03180 [Lachnospiraceae bacterium]|nr:hypothetical protein [Lachnospiraceae bacterium]